jgi:hypothetical protein
MLLHCGVIYTDKPYSLQWIACSCPRRLLPGPLSSQLPQHVEIMMLLGVKKCRQNEGVAIRIVKIVKPVSLGLDYKHHCRAFIHNW